MNFPMVIMASGIVCGRVRTTTTAMESRKMAAIIQTRNRGAVVTAL